MSATLDLDPGTRAALERARETGAPKPPGLLEAARDLRQSGGFRVTQGRFVYDEDAVDPAAPEDEGGTGDAARMAAASGFDALRGVAVEEPDADHAIFQTSGPFGPNGHGITNSLCVGADCTTSEDYGTDTIRLRESTLRIAFDDSSGSTSGFPFQDWEILANDQTSGGLNRFSVYDQTADTVPLTVEGDAPDDSLYVDDQGRVGLGTATPQQRLHLITGDTPSIRLEQDATQSLPTRTWDLGASEDELFVRDVPNSNAKPLRVAAGAPTDALAVDATGEVGLGTHLPERNLHVFGGDGTAEILVEENNTTAGDHTLLTLETNGSGRISLVDNKGTFADDTDDTAWFIQNERVGNQLLLSRDGTGAPEVIVRERLEDDWNPTFEVDGAILSTMALRVDRPETTTGSRILTRLRNKGSVGLQMQNTDDVTWNLTNASAGMFLSVVGSGVNELWLDESGNLVIQGTLTENSNRESKTHIKQVDPALVLERVLDLPIATWQRKGEPQVTHLGPMAQDFRALFGLGLDDTSIATIDVAGVALAAIQGQQGEIERLERENDELRSRVRSLEALEARLAALEAQLAER